jgi:hypothetical protein
MDADNAPAVPEYSSAYYAANDGVQARTVSTAVDDADGLHCSPHTSMVMPQSTIYPASADLAVAREIIFTFEAIGWLARMSIAQNSFSECLVNSSIFR